MRKPQQPPPVEQLISRVAGSDSLDFVNRILDSSIAGSRYLPWDELRRRRPPEGLTSEQWWLSTKLARTGMRRPLPLLDKNGRQFSYALPDEVLRGIEEIDKQASGRIGVPAPVSPDAPDRERYMISSLIEEAITSSQLEGASTTQRVAEEMLRTGRKPQTKDERMIVNNYAAISEARDARAERLRPETGQRRWVERD